MRIVSLLPSATDIVLALGLGDRLVGISHECDDPVPARPLPRVTRSLIPSDASSGEIDRTVRERLRARQPLYALDVAALQALAPDLIITQALCDVCAVAEEDVREAACALASAPRVLNLEPRVLADLFACVRQVAAAAGVEPAGERLVAELADRVATVERRSAGRRPVRVAFLEWLDPPFSGGHWNPELVRLAGGEDPFGRAGEPARTLAWEEVLAWRPEAILIAACGHDAARAAADFRRTLRGPEWSGQPAVRAGRVWVADGSRHFSRPGPGLVDSLELLAHALDPELHPPPTRVTPAVRLAPARRSRARATLLSVIGATALLAGCDPERRALGTWELVTVDGVGPAVASPLRVMFPAGVYGEDTLPDDWMWQEYQVDSLVLAVQPGGSFHGRSTEATRMVVHKNDYVRPDYVSPAFGGDLVREAAEPSFEEITGSWTLAGDSIVLSQPRDQVVAAVAARVLAALPSAPEGEVREAVNRGLAGELPPRWVGRVRGDQLELRDPDGRVLVFRKAAVAP